jgi:lipoyl(octanoyl) transferase
MMDVPGTSRDTDAIIVRTLGRTDYAFTWQAMQDFTAARHADTSDEIWLTEHPPIYTLGLAGKREHLLRDNGIPILKVDRGGQVTYHGPGQLVAYVLFDLPRWRLTVRDAVRAIEGGVVKWLASLAIVAAGDEKAPGVYVDTAAGRAKIGALGLKIRHGRSYHGAAINIAMNLAPFHDINPCGFPGLAVTQLADLGVARTVESAGAEFAPFLAAALTAKGRR